MSIAGIEDLRPGPLTPEEAEAVQSLWYRTYKGTGGLVRPIGGPRMGFNASTITEEIKRLGLDKSGTEYRALLARREREAARRARLALWKTGAWTVGITVAGLLLSAALFGH